MRKLVNLVAIALPASGVGVIPTTLVLHVLTGRRCGGRSARSRSQGPSRSAGGRRACARRRTLWTMTALLGAAAPPGGRRRRDADGTDGTAANGAGCSAASARRARRRVVAAPRCCRAASARSSLNAATWSPCRDFGVRALERVVADVEGGGDGGDGEAAKRPTPRWPRRRWRRGLRTSGRSSHHARRRRRLSGGCAGRGRRRGRSARARGARRRSSAPREALLLRRTAARAAAGLLAEAALPEYLRRDECGAGVPDHAALAAHRARRRRLRGLRGRPPEIPARCRRGERTEQPARGRMSCSAKSGGNATAGVGAHDAEYAAAVARGQTDGPEATDNPPRARKTAGGSRWRGAQPTDLPAGRARARRARRASCQPHVVAAEHAAARGEELAGSGLHGGETALRLCRGRAAQNEVRRRPRALERLSRSTASSPSSSTSLTGSVRCSRRTCQWEYVKIFMLPDALCCRRPLPSLPRRLFLLRRPCQTRARRRPPRYKHAGGATGSSGSTPTRCIRRVRPSLSLARPLRRPVFSQVQPAEATSADLWLRAVPRQARRARELPLANTGTLGLRTRPGRALMAEWLAVAADGAVECHPPTRRRSSCCCSGSSTARASSGRPSATAAASRAAG